MLLTSIMSLCLPSLHSYPPCKCPALGQFYIMLLHSNSRSEDDCSMKPCNHASQPSLPPFLIALLPFLSHKGSSKICFFPHACGTLSHLFTWQEYLNFLPFSCFSTSWPAASNVLDLFVNWKTVLNGSYFPWHFWVQGLFLFIFVCLVFEVFLDDLELLPVSW